MTQRHFKDRVYFTQKLKSAFCGDYREFGTVRSALRCAAPSFHLLPLPARPPSPPPPQDLVLVSSSTASPRASSHLSSPVLLHRGAPPAAFHYRPATLPAAPAAVAAPHAAGASPGRRRSGGAFLGSLRGRGLVGF